MLKLNNMPKILNIILNPNPVLRKKSVEVEVKKVNTENFKKLFRDMAFTMLKKDGVGLAAPQIGKNIRLITINIEGRPFIMINPEIKRKSIKKEWGEEGCLSVPRTFGKVLRHFKIQCVFINALGKKDKISASGFIARIIQHELDHLDGILFVDKAKDVKIT